MKSLAEKVHQAKAIRLTVADQLATIMAESGNQTELSLKESIVAAFSESSDVFAEGWYAPPPQGVSVLCADEAPFARLKYDSLRKEEFWPRSDISKTNNSVTMLYASPVAKETAIIGDIGLTLYAGQDEAVREHVRKTLTTMESVIDHLAVGMRFQEVYEVGKDKCVEAGLTPNRMRTFHDPLGINFGHTVPFSYEEPTKEEQTILHTGDIRLVKEVVSKKRLYHNQAETFTIPETCAFTLEVRLESVDDECLPNVLWHYIVTFTNGQKEVVCGFNQIFQAVKMDYVTSRYN